MSFYSREGDRIRKQIRTLTLARNRARKAKDRGPEVGELESRVRGLYADLIGKYPEDTRALVDFTRFCIETGRASEAEKVLASLPDLPATGMIDMNFLERIIRARQKALLLRELSRPAEAVGILGRIVAAFERNRLTDVPEYYENRLLLAQLLYLDLKELDDAREAYADIFRGVTSTVATGGLLTSVGCRIVFDSILGFYEVEDKFDRTSAWRILEKGIEIFQKHFISGSRELNALKKMLEDVTGKG